MSDKLGFISSMPNDEYHSLSGISKSGLDKIDRSPAHYKYGERKPSTRNMEIGTAIHCAILEPVRFDNEYVITESETRTAAEYKKQKALHGGELTLTKQEGKKIKGMQESIHNDLEAMKILTSEGEAELSAICIDPETGIQIRSRFDWLSKDGTALDLKKTQDARQQKFSRSICDYRYHVQDAMYSFVYELITGEKLKAFKFLAVEEDAPHACKVYELDELSKEIGFHYFRKNLRTYAECLSKDKWPIPEMGDGIIELPNWEINKYEEDLEVLI